MSFYVHQVALIDYGSEMAVSGENLWVLPVDCASVPSFALRCHLDGVVPAGDITKWSRTACETLHSILTVLSSCFLAPKVFSYILLDIYYKLIYKAPQGRNVRVAVSSQRWPKLSPVLIAPIHGGMARLSGPE